MCVVEGRSWWVTSFCAITRLSVPSRCMDRFLSPHWTDCTTVSQHSWPCVEQINKHVHLKCFIAIYTCLAIRFRQSTQTKASIDLDSRKTSSQLSPRMVKHYTTLLHQDNTQNDFVKSVTTEAICSSLWHIHRLHGNVLVRLTLDTDASISILHQYHPTFT